MASEAGKIVMAAKAELGEELYRKYFLAADGTVYGSPIDEFWRTQMGKGLNGKRLLNALVKECRRREKSPPPQGS